jgi:RNA polymerase sigma factor (sigma-70 family)
MMLRNREVPTYMSRETANGVHEPESVRPASDTLELLYDPSAVAILSQAVSEMSRQEQLVVTLAHYEEMTVDEIAEILDLTQEQVCDIERDVVARLQQALMVGHTHNDSR